MLLDFVLPDKVSLEELGTTKKLCITFLLRSGLLFCFNPSSIRINYKDSSESVIILQQFTDQSHWKFHYDWMPGS